MKRQLQYSFVFVIGIFVNTFAVGAGEWLIGFNEPFVAGYMQSLGQCPGCPTNTYQASQDLITGRILDLAANNHVGAFREIVPLSALHSSQNATNYQPAIDIIAKYSEFNLTLVLTLGLPMPAWMTPTGDGFNVMPDDDASWGTLKNTLSWEMGNFVSALWNSPKISRAWMLSHLYVEGFNEFDSLHTLSGSTNRASPARAADLQNGIQWVLNQYGIQVKTLMPSVVGAYSGYQSPPSNLQAQYVTDYYSAGGSGAPNVHVYVRNDDAGQGYSVMLGKLRNQVAAINASLPASQKGQIVLGETGASDRVDPYCTASTSASTLEISQRDLYYAAVAADSQINSQVNMILFWRLMNLPVAQIPNCEAFFGAVNQDNSGYKGVGVNLFNYLKN
ncbi:hypothetical protein POK33_13040 [Burkholderia cenocepacia]|uniref:hypothetical protein n=1 Tax=Burkholderia cenocepacia TaxID=95486 RepID=UPI0023B97418|nr:hypothetical protein [Burkholderia cenocepacia]MDF0501645.1 hypothetical protein [Burkholderia cenocepacia]